MPRLTARTRDARRQQILAAARRCFTRNGFQATSMQDILAEAGLSAGSVYSHFTAKDEIITAIPDDRINPITATPCPAAPAQTRPQGRSVSLQQSSGTTPASTRQSLAAARHMSGSAGRGAGQAPSCLV